jgi:hypothetical protein
VDGSWFGELLQQAKERGLTCIITLQIFELFWDFWAFGTFDCYFKYLSRIIKLNQILHPHLVASFSFDFRSFSITYF